MKTGNWGHLTKVYKISLQKLKMNIKDFTEVMKTTPVTPHSNPKKVQDLQQDLISNARGAGA